ncbi:MAG: GrpB family protein [Candidatus Heimdallarchaeota archaeon]
MSEKVNIEEYNPVWIELFEKERELILSSIGQYVDRIEHSGSTSVIGLASKPIIDIAIGLRSLNDAIHCVPLMQKLDYQYVPEYEVELPMRRYFRKPPNGSGIRKYHVHMVETTSDFWKDHLMFRDYLRKHENSRDDYALLKKNLAIKYEDDRSAYSNAKTDFVNKILELARKEK